jgi:hypothetical protein
LAFDAKFFFCFFAAIAYLCGKKKMEETMSYFRIGLIATSVVLGVVAIVAWFRSRK